MHSDCETLIRYCDGELSPRERRAVETHLEQCEACRLECHRLCNSLAAPVADVPEMPGLLSDILDSVRHWETARPHAGPAAAALKERVGARLAPLLGAAATRRLLDPVPESGEGLLGAIEPVLALFCGSRTASDFMHLLGNDVIMRL